MVILDTLHLHSSADESFCDTEKHEEERVNCVLPLIPGSSPDCNRIDATTVEMLLSGYRTLSLVLLFFLIARIHFDDRIEKYVIMDCRYDYEFNGGHIRTAVNITPEQIYEYFRGILEVAQRPYRCTESVDCDKICPSLCVPPLLGRGDWLS